MNIGVVIPHVGGSQLAFLAINQVMLVDQFTSHNAFLFTQYDQPPCMPIGVSCMNISEMYGFSGLLITTDLESTYMSLKAVNDNPRIMYVWDLEWLRKNKNNFVENIQIYRHPALELVARSEDHAKAIENYCNRKPAAIIPNFNLLEIVNALDIRQ